MGFYVESADRPYASRQGAEDLHAGTLVTTDGNNMYVNADANDERLDALVTKPRSAPHIAYDIDDASGERVYEADDRRVPALPLADGDVIKALTVTESNAGVTTAPDIQSGDVVGVVDTTDADAPADGGRVVEEGYTNDENDDAADTTFERANGNFLPLGVAERDSETTFDAAVRVRVNRENLQ